MLYGAAECAFLMRSSTGVAQTGIRVSGHDGNWQTHALYRWISYHTSLTFFAFLFRDLKKRTEEKQQKDINTHRKDLAHLKHPLQHPRHPLRKHRVQRCRAQKYHNRTPKPLPLLPPQRLQRTHNTMRCPLCNTTPRFGSILRHGTKDDIRTTETVFEQIRVGKVAHKSVDVRRVSGVGMLGGEFGC